MTSRVTVGEGEAGRRTDQLIAEKLGLTRSAVQRLIEGGHVSLGGAPVAKSALGREGDAYEVDLPEPQPSTALPQEIPLDIVYEDGHIIVINKSRDMVVHPAAGNPDGTLVNALLAHCGGLSGVGGVLRPGVVHRLDKDTTGLLVCAKTDAAHLALSEQLAARTMKRIYVALLHGAPKDQGVVDAPIGRDKRDRKRMAVSPDGRAAVTRYRVLEQYGGFALVECALQSGRTHQIRVHMASIGHPVAGDRVYGPKKPMPGTASQLLHARELELTHPETGERMSFEAPLPDFFIEVLTKLRNRG